MEFLPKLEQKHKYADHRLSCNGDVSELVDVVEYAIFPSCYISNFKWMQSVLNDRHSVDLYLDNHYESKWSYCRLTTFVAGIMIGFKLQNVDSTLFWLMSGLSLKIDKGFKLISYSLSF